MYTLVLMQYQEIGSLGGERGLAYDRQQLQLTYAPSVLATAVPTARETAFHSGLVHTFTPPPRKYIHNL